jgi:hypothetical protein
MPTGHRYECDNPERDDQKRNPAIPPNEAADFTSTHKRIG